jgi:hypothetical protein
VSDINNHKRDIYATHDKGIYESGKWYEPFDEVSHNGIVAIAERNTQEAPEIVPIGGLQDIIPSNEPLTEAQDTSIVTVVYDITVTKSGFFVDTQLNVPFWDSDVYTRIKITNISTGEFSVRENIILTQETWKTIATSYTGAAIGDQYKVQFDYYNSSSANRITGGWTSALGTGIPLNRAFTIDNLVTPTVLEISHTDLDNTDRSTELDGVVVDSIIHITETADPTRTIELKVTAVDTLAANSTGYLVDVIANGDKNIRDARICTISIDVPITQPSKYYVVNDYFTLNMPSWCTVTSELYYDGVLQPALNTNAYGINLTFQEAELPKDWRIKSGLASVGGSGVPTPPASGNVELVSNDGAVSWDERPYTVDGTNPNKEINFLYTGNFPSNSILIGPTLKQSDIGGQSVNLNLKNKTRNYSVRAAIDESIGNGETTGVFYRRRYDSFYDDPAQPLFDKSIPSVLNVTTGRYEHVQTQVEIGDLITESWKIRPTTDMVNVQIEAYINYGTPDEFLFWMRSSPQAIKDGLGFAHTYGGVPVDVEVKLAPEGSNPLDGDYLQEDGETVTFVVSGDNNFVMLGSEFEIAPAVFADYAYILGTGVKWEPIKVPTEFEGNVPPHGVVDGVEGDYYLYKDGRSTTKYIYKNTVPGNDSWYRFTNPIIESGGVSDIEQSLNMNEGQFYGVLSLIPETDIGNFLVSINTNGLNIGTTCDLYVMFLSNDFLTVLHEEVIQITDATPIRSLVINYASLYESYQDQAIKVIIGCNNYSGGGVLSLKKHRQKGVNDDTISFRKDGVLGAPSLEDWTVGRVTVNETLFWIGYRL